MPRLNYCINCRKTVDPNDHDKEHTIFADVAKKTIAQLGTLVIDALASAGKPTPAVKVKRARAKKKAK